MPKKIQNFGLSISWFLDLRSGRQGFAFLGIVDHFADDNLKTDRLTPEDVSFIT